MEYQIEVLFSLHLQVVNGFIYAFYMGYQNQTCIKIKYLAIVLTEDGKFDIEIRRRIAMTKDVCQKQSIKRKKNLVKNKKSTGLLHPFCLIWQ